MVSEFAKLGKYPVIGKIGQGSFGVVYKGRDPHLKREVAIKVCSVDDAGLRRRFFREAEISGRLRHENIVMVFDFGLEGEVPYLVQEYLSGQDLNVLIKRKAPLTTEEKLDYLSQVATGLAYAHSQGVIHRDIKPANLRLLEDGRIKIMDFGIAKLASAETQLTQKGVTMGTASYLPPEQVRGGEVDHRADVFSFGVLAYELLTYEKPFRGNTLSALVYQILYKVPLPMASVWLECPVELSDLVARCLEKSPDGRFASFTELLPQLSSIQQGVNEGRWPELRGRSTVAKNLGPGGTEDSDVMSHSLISMTAREVAQGNIGDATISVDATVGMVDLGTLQALPHAAEDTESTQPVPVIPPPGTALENTVPAATVSASVPPPPEPVTEPPIFDPALGTATVKMPSQLPDQTAGSLPGSAREVAAEWPTEELPSPPPLPERKAAALAEADLVEADFADADFADAADDLAAATVGELPSERLGNPSAATSEATIKLEDSLPLVERGQEIGELVARGNLEAARRQLEQTIADATAEDLELPPILPAMPEGSGAQRPSPLTTIRRRPAWQIVAAAVAAALFLVVIGWWLSRGASEPPAVVAPAAAVPPPVVDTEPVALAQETGAVVINALPWAEIVEVTDTEGYLQELTAGSHTPMRLELPLGQYRITLRHPDHAEPQTCDIEISANLVESCAAEFYVPEVSQFFKENGWWQ